MARRNIFDRAREFIAGASKRVTEFFTNFADRTDELSEEQALREIIDFEAAAGDENQPILNEPESDSDEEIAERFDELDRTIPTFPPEQPDDEGEEEEEEIETEFNFERAPFGLFDPKELRRVLVTFEEAESYARDISLPPSNITIIKDTDTGLFRVRVDYEVVIS